MPDTILPKRLGFFTRLLEDASPGDRYRFATEQIVHAEANGFDSAWIAQHHFHRDEGGLPSPLVFLAHVAARTERIRLGTGIITLPLEHPIRAAEDAAVLDLLSGGRLELGLGSGGTPSSFTAFGYDVKDKATIYDKHLETFRTALSGSPLAGDTRLYPAAPQLLERFWQATFSVAGGARAGKAGDGLMLSRTQPRPAENLGASLADLQHPIIDAYLENLPGEIAPRITASRTLFVADSRDEARHYAGIGLRKAAIGLAKSGHKFESDDLDYLIAATDTHVGTVDDVLESLSRDSTLPRVTDIVFQVHSVDPPHELTLRSIELIAAHVAPQLGWARSAKPAPRLSVVR
ncbi:putative FMN-dependent luciferase-like monooxygenase [Devosia sp. ZB163]|uniref:putative FMN-dependent luciferase-like monooxygenase n=1 Tax=Devosia sp. ZB163 TaxID=3025938 RepID=UPI00235DDE91|nr:putative FMN-dependent luciferase-like monooxygenase [Devosia sp. ZB163]MDC9825345.1 putative FMN-dependent luciferase-like monooxygenase [Devosia sp. ZB163]